MGILFFLSVASPNSSLGIRVNGKLIMLCLSKAYATGGAVEATPVSVQQVELYVS